MPAFDPDGKKLYLTFVVQPDPQVESYQTKTAEYDAKTLEQLSEIDPEETGLFIRSHHCFLSQDRLFTGWYRVFDINSDTQVGKIDVPRYTYPADCQQGALLTISSEDAKTVLTIMDLQQNRIIRRIPTSFEFRLSDREWHLSPDATYVISDRDGTIERPSGVRASAKTGNLTFFDIQSGKKMKDLKIELKRPEFSGLMDIAPDGSQLIYLSFPNKVILIDYPSLQTREVELSIEPRWVVRGRLASESQ